MPCSRTQPWGRSHQYVAAIQCVTSAREDGEVDSETRALYFVTRMSVFSSRTGRSNTDVKACLARPGREHGLATPERGNSFSVEA